jgi:hypothetical protein
MRLYCLLRGHQPKRSKAYFDGNVYHAPCRWCDAAMVKLPEHGKWTRAERALANESSSRHRARP